jgi:hypothetical protein
VPGRGRGGRPYLHWEGVYVRLCGSDAEKLPTWAPSPTPHVHPHNDQNERQGAAQGDAILAFSAAAMMLCEEEARGREGGAVYTLELGVTAQRLSPCVVSLAVCVAVGADLLIQTLLFIQLRATRTNARP